MIKTITVSGSSLEEATKKAVDELGAESAEELDVEVVEEGKSGLLGLGSKETVISATYIPQSIRAGLRALKSILEAMSLPAEISLEEDDGCYMIDVEGDGLALLIGKKGHTLEAVQYIVNTVCNRAQKERMSVIVDAHGYKANRRLRLEEEALRTARRVKESGQEAELQPMAAWERRMIHVALVDHPDVETYSEGEGMDRRVIITPKRDI